MLDSRSVNNVLVAGRLGKDPEVKDVSGGYRVCNFSIATTEYNKKSNDSKTLWHTFEAWDKLADNCAKALKKGDMVFISAKIRYKTGKDNMKKTVFRLTEFTLLDRPNNGNISTGTVSEVSEVN